MKNYKFHLQCAGNYYYNNRIWFSNLGFNGLFSINTEDLSVRYECEIPSLPKNHRGEYCCYPAFYNDIMFFFPNNCSQLFIYNVKNGATYDISINSSSDLEIYKTAEIMQLEDKVWIFPQTSSQGVHILDLSTLHVEQDMELSKLVESINDEIMVAKVSKTELAVFSVGGNQIVEIDIKRKKKLKHKCFKENINFQNIIYDSKSSWILQRDSTDIYEWRRNEDKLVKYSLTEENWITNNKEHIMPYSNLVFLNDQIIVLGGRLKYIMKIDTATQAIYKAIDYPEGFRFLMNNGLSGWPAFSRYSIIEGKIWLYPILGNMLLIYDIENNYIEGKELAVTTDQLPFLRDIIIDNFNDDVCYEGKDEFCSLGMFLDVADKLPDSINIGLNIGKEIYDAIGQAG